LTSDNTEVRKVAAETLALICKRNPVEIEEFRPELREIIRSGADTETKAMVIDLLRRIGSKTVVDPVTDNTDIPS